MLNNKKGLSAVITTLIIILLVLVAVGILWVIIRGIVEEGAIDIEYKLKCMDVNVRATIVDCSDPTACDITLTRGAGGDAIDGVRIVFYEGALGGNVVNVPGDIGVLGTIQVTGEVSGLANPDSVEVSVYFIDDSGHEQLCAQPNPFNF